MTPMGMPSSDPLSIATKEFERNQFPLAAKFAQYALARDPDCGHSWEILGHSLLHMGKIAEGADAIEQASVRRPITKCSSIALAIAYGSLGRKTLSRDLLLELGEYGSLDVDQWLQVATGLEAIDEPRLAMEACRRAGKISPETPTVHFQLGYYASKCGYPSSVTEALIRHAIGLDPNNLHYRMGLASLLIRLGREDQALESIDPMIPDRLEEITCQCCLKRIANLFFDVGDESRARRCAQRLAELKSADDDHHAEDLHAQPVAIT